MANTRKNKLATIETVGYDENGIPLSAGEAQNGDVVTAKMIADPGNPAIGAMAVSLESSSPAAAPAFSPLAAPIFVAGPGSAPLSAASLPCKSVTLLADDGNSLGNSNTDVIWIGSAAVAVGTNGLPLRPGQAISLDLADLSTLYAVSASPGQVLTMLVVG